MHKVSFRNDILPLRDKLYRVALRITLDAAEAEDIVQDTMLRVWNRRDEWQQYGSVEAYCLVVARNLSIDRSRRMEASHLELTPEMQDASATVQDPHELLERDERIRLLHRLLALLPERQRTVVQLRDVEEKSYKEIACLLQMTEDQVKVTLFRARKAIKEQYMKIDRYGL